MIPVLVTVFAAVLGLAFGSFLNVCATRWPEEESIVKRRSHCRHCDRTLAWWENVPLVSWLALGGRCRTCKAWIGWRYPLVELSVGLLWAYSAWSMFNAAPELNAGIFSYNAAIVFTKGIFQMIFLWLLMALAVLDAENLWLPDRLILPGIGLGFVLAMIRSALAASMLQGTFAAWKPLAARAIANWLISAVASAGALLIIRWVYQMVRDQEGIGLGDIKLMAMLGGWFGVIKMGLLVLVLGIVIGGVVALLQLAVASRRTKGESSWGLKKLPLGTFLCLAGIITVFWGRSLIAIYLRWSGL